MNEQNKDAGVTNIDNNTSGADVVTGQVSSPADTEKSGNPTIDNAGNIELSRKDNTADGGKKKQDSETNRRFAQQRREQQDAEKRAKQELEFYQREIGKNPWTDEPIEDAADIEQYRLMKQIEKEGGDPLSDYAKRLNKDRKEKTENSKKSTSGVSFSQLSEEQRETRIKEDIVKFEERYPNKSVADIFEDKEFMSFAGDLLGEVSLATLYGLYEKTSELKTKKANDIEKKATQIANSQASVGSLSSSAKSEDGDFFTKEQVLKMSQAEISKNYDKIRKSQEKW